MKKILSVLLIVLAMCCLGACSSSQNESDTNSSSTAEDGSSGVLEDVGDDIETGVSDIGNCVVIYLKIFYTRNVIIKLERQGW